MLRIRLRRTGATKVPHYRVVVAESSAPRDGAFVDIIGHYHPLTEPAQITIDEARALKWLSQGAQPTKVVQKLLTKVGVWDGFQAQKPGA